MTVAESDCQRSFAGRPAIVAAVPQENCRSHQKVDVRQCEVLKSKSVVIADNNPQKGNTAGI